MYVGAFLVASSRVRVVKATDFKICWDYLSQVQILPTTCTRMSFKKLIHLCSGYPDGKKKPAGIYVIPLGSACSLLEGQ